MLMHKTIFCSRECLGEAHEPASCDSWKKWHQKIAEIKPEERECVVILIEKYDQKISTVVKFVAVETKMCKKDGMKCNLSFGSTLYVPALVI